MRYYPFGIILLTLVSYSLTGCAADTKKVNAADTKKVNKVETCIACHGVDGKHGKEGVPDLGGRPYEELVQAMQNQRDSSFTQPLIVHVMSDAEMREIATYFSSVK